jgi:hypothetical protein
MKWVAKSAIKRVGGMLKDGVEGGSIQVNVDVNGKHYSTQRTSNDNEAKVNGKKAQSKIKGDPQGNSKSDKSGGSASSGGRRSKKSTRSTHSEEI